jgi:hypothetical protein
MGERQRQSPLWRGKCTAAHAAVGDAIASVLYVLRLSCTVSGLSVMSADIDVHFVWTRGITERCATRDAFTATLRASLFQTCVCQGHARSLRSSA